MTAGHVDARGPTLTHQLLTAEYMIHKCNVYSRYRDRVMGLVKIDDELHEEARRASAVMCRSINAQAEFWMKIGMLAEANPTTTFSDIVKAQLAEANVRLVQPLAA